MPITPFNSLRNPHSVNQTYLNGLGNTVTTGNGYAAIVRLVDVTSMRWTPDNPGQTGTSWSYVMNINEDNLTTYGSPFSVYLGGSGIEMDGSGGWSTGLYNCDGTLNGGQPTHASYTAFFSQDDYLNSDMSGISPNPQMWEVGKQLSYTFDSEDVTWSPIANGAVRANFTFTFEIIEVVDEATYNNGAGVPSGPFITQATYGDIPVGTIMATPGDPNCNGCTDLYDNIGIRTRQGEAINQNPGYFLTQSGPYIPSGSSANISSNTVNDPFDVSFSYPYTVLGVPIAGASPTTSSTHSAVNNGMTSGWYLGSLFSICKQVCKACRDPYALNYDKSTSPVWDTNFSNPPPGNISTTLFNFLDTTYGNPQRDCSGDFQFPFESIISTPDGPSTIWDYDPKDTDCCLYKIENGSGSGSGCDSEDPRCGCMDPNAANFCSVCTEDCLDVTAGSDTSCCEYYHMWEICGAHGAYVPSYNMGINGFEGVIATPAYPVLFNLTGNNSNSGNMSQVNSPDTNQEFLDYVEAFQGAPVGGLVIGDRIQMRSMGMVSDWWCLEYKGPQPNNAAFYDNLAGGTGTSSSQHWRSHDWWNTPPATTGTLDLLMDPDCFTCTNPELANPSYREYTVCDGPHAGEIINVINSWATDPVDHFLNNNPGNPNFWLFSNEIGLVKPNMSCTTCQSGVAWMLLGETLEVTFSGVKYCLEYTGASTNPKGTDTGGWIEGIGAGTDNFIKIDPQDPSDLQDIWDNCNDCNINIIEPCIPICTDPDSFNYNPGPWSTNQCDCNGDPIGTEALGWNDCCGPDPCDGHCNDPLANNYDPTATGCCGSGLGIGAPISENTEGNCDDSDTIVTGQYSTSTFHQYLSTQANGLTSIDVDTIQYENMDSVWFGAPTPPGTCVGPNGGYMTSFSLSDGYIPHSSIQADINPGSPGTVYTTWDALITQCITTGVTGVTTQTTFDELNILLTAWNPNGAGIPVEITPPTNVFCQCEYASYTQNNDCCTYNWTCSSDAPAFAQQWPVQDSNSARSNVKTQYNKKFGLTISDINPRPESTFNHINDTGYVFPGTAYLNTPLRLSNFRNLGLHFNSNEGSQGWGGGKQPKLTYTNIYPKEWGYAYSFMQAITDGTIINGDTIDLTQAYYKVKTNMISLEGNFLNKKAKVITTTIPGGTAATGLYYHIIPAGSITIPQQFQSVFPTVAGIKFNTWKSFYKELLNYNLPASATTWESVSNWIIDKVENAPGLSDVAHKAAPEFARESIQWMVSATSGCLCYEDPSGPYATQTECQTTLTNPDDNSQNCCACVYGCTDPTAYNYNPLASCDDGSCLDCEPFIIKQCNFNVYYLAYQCSTIQTGDCWMTPMTCIYSQALLTSWGMQNYGDVITFNYNPNYDPIPGTNPLPATSPGTYCWQWVDPNDTDYLNWLSLGNTLGPTTVPQQWSIEANHAPGLNLTLTPYDNTSYATTCSFCGDTEGCTDPVAVNYDPAANTDDGSCIYCVYGCTDSTTEANGFPDINGYDNTAVYDCVVSTTVPTSGSLCPYPCVNGYAYSNYSPCASCDDGTCEQPEFHKWSACSGDPAGEFTLVAPGATNTDIFAQDWFWQNVGSPAVGETINTIDGTGKTCYEYKGTSATSLGSPGFAMPQMSLWEFDEIWNTDCTSCTCIYGCTDPTMCNYDATATCDDGSCCNETGCLDPIAFNYCATCCCEGPCEAVKKGCMDSTANNYDPTANTACANCCDYTVYGCTDINAINFDPTATINATSATDPTDPCKYLDQCKRAPREFGSDPTKKLNIECEFASDVYKEYRKERYGLSNYCGSDLPDHLHEKQLCDWEDTKRPAYLSSTIEVLATYEYPIVEGEPDWLDPARPAWTIKNCGLVSDVDIDIYFMYDCTSMGIAAIQQQRNAADDWINGFAEPFAGEVYHVLVCGERWVDWATTIFTGNWNNAGTCGGTDSFCVVNSVAADYGSCLNAGRADAVAPTDMSVTHKFWAPMAWGNINNKAWYSSAPLGYDNGTITHFGYPPALTKREVLGVFFADESATGTGTGSDAQPYHVNGCSPNACTTTWPQATDGTGTNAADSVLTECFKADYDKYIEKYKMHLAKGPLHKATMVIYPAKPLVTPHPAHRGFPLHALAAVDSGNNVPKDGRYATGTRPNNSLVDLINIETGNPYWDTTNPNQPSSHTYGYGGLDNYGWRANVASGTFNSSLFKADLEKYWDPNKLKCGGSECILVNVVNQNNVAIPDYSIYVDGGFKGKTDEFGRLQFQIENAAAKTNHIINFCLCLETKGNCRQQQIKIVVNEECAPECCVDPTGVSCETYKAPTQVFEGCTDPNASNYNTMATVDDGSCLYCNPEITIYETHINASAAGVNDGSITTGVSSGTLPYTYSWTGPSGYTASTAVITNLAGGIYNLTVTDGRNCTARITINLDQPPLIYGCMDNAYGLWPNINGVNQIGAVCSYPCTDDGTLTGAPKGYKYFCFNPDATDPDTCCEAGCTDPNAVTGPQGYCASCTHDCNMEPIGTNNPGWDSCCDLCVNGCMDPIAGNYNPNATCDDGNCVYYWECDEAAYDINEIIQYNYTLSNINNTGIYVDTSCPQGFCDIDGFYFALADYYSTAGNTGLIPAQEVTAVANTTGNSNFGSFSSWNACPLTVLQPNFPEAENNPLLTLTGFTTENTHGPTGSASCYAQLQITQFGANYIFPTWGDYVDWHNGAGGPNQTCSGSQILPIQTGQDYSYVVGQHYNINSSGDMYSPDPEDNWVYFKTYEPQCTGYNDCECNRILTEADNDGMPGTHPTEQECDDAINCCGEQPVEIGGCIDNGYVDQHPDFGTYGAVTVDNWWINAQNAAGISYSQLIKCTNGIVAHELVINGGAGTVGTGVPNNYQYGVPALNYDPLATYDDGSCCYCTGCMESLDLNYEEQACFSDIDLCVGSEPPPILGCMDPAALTYDGNANTHQPAACTYAGCMDSNASNFMSFEVNGLVSYEWGGNLGYYYNSSDIVASCTSCCAVPPTYFECTAIPFSNPCFDGSGAIGHALTNSSGNGGDFSSRHELSRSYQLTQFTNSCQTMSYAMTDWNDDQSAVYAWSNATSGSLEEYANDWFFWSATNSSFGCAWSSAQINTVYTNMNYQSPIGTSGFNIGSGSSGSMVQKSHAKPMIISAMAIYDSDSNGQGQLWYRDYNTSTLSWGELRSELINTYGFDGTGGKPDITGLDARQVEDLLSANSTNWEQIWVGFCSAACTLDVHNVCLPSPVGTMYSSCAACESGTGCACGGC
tara:strand:+ start:8150 stop:17923 length:9774 start_codon:yes stop_codon:yes gene_type:complete